MYKVKIFTNNSGGVLEEVTNEWFKKMDNSIEIISITTLTPNHSMGFAVFYKRKEESIKDNTLSSVAV